MSDKDDILQDKIDSLWSAVDSLIARVNTLEGKPPKVKPSILPLPEPRLEKRYDRKITGYEISITPGRGDRVTLIWRDLKETEEAEARGESSLMGHHDFEVPYRVIGAAAQMLKERGLIP